MDRGLPPLLASRFVALDDNTSLDLASGERVVIVRRALDAVEAALWPKAVARLAQLWHPALATCVDYGFVNETEWFEAYAVSDAPRISCRGIAATAAAFLASHGIPCALRTLPVRGSTMLVPADLRETADESPPPAAAGFGLRLASRGLEVEIVSALETLRGPGPHLWAIDAPAGAGWTTTWRQVAREARLRGFVPVDARMLESAVRRPDGRVSSWVALLESFPLLVHHERREWTLGDRRQLARLLLRLGGGDAPRIVVLDVVTRGRSASARLRLGPIEPDSLAEGLWVPRGLCSGQWLRARSLARACDGLPGAFVRRIATRLGCDAEVPTVHERPPAFGDDVDEPVAPDPVQARARALAAGGRAAAAERRAIAAARHGARRNDRLIAARRLGLAASMAALRGAMRASRSLWCEATSLTTERGVHAMAECAADVAEQWVRQAQLEGAERLLHSAIAAMLASGERPPARTVRLLSACLCWQARWDEAAAVGEEHAAPAALVWPRIERLDLEGATAAAHAACSSAAPDCCGRSAGLVLAVALGAIDALGAAIPAAPPVRLLTLDDDDRCLLPIEGLVRRRVRLDARARDLLRRLARAGSPRLTRARARLALALSETAPAQHAPIAQQADRAARATGARALAAGVSRISAWPPPQDDRSLRMLDDLVAVLRVCQSEDDPRCALMRVADLLCARLRAAALLVAAHDGRRVTTIVGQGRHDMAATVSRAADSRQPRLDENGAGATCAVPVLLGERLVGIAACHWPLPGAGVAAAGQALLEAAATAIAPTLALAGELAARPAAGVDGSLLLGVSEAMTAVRAAVDAAARVPFTVLIDGESGSGKELVAREIHRLGPRRQRSLCAVNCAALTDELCEAELFGHTRGAFTGAVADRAGLFEEADGGTLFLDEVGELSPRAQAKLLRALQEGEIRRVGETRPRRVDVRVVAATNRPLADAVDAGAFRGDLRYRLDVIHITVPPLRERTDDVPLLAHHFWARATERIGSSARLAAETAAALARYHWPGNVRELQNVLAALAAHAPRSGVVPVSALPDVIAHGPGTGVTLEEARRRADAHVVRAALARAGGHRGRAASALGVTRQGLAKLVDRLRLDDTTPPRPTT